MEVKQQGIQSVSDCSRKCHYFFLQYNKQVNLHPQGHVTGAIKSALRDVEVANSWIIKMSELNRSSPTAVCAVVNTFMSLQSHKCCVRVVIISLNNRKKFISPWKSGLIAVNWFLIQLSNKKNSSFISQSINSKHQVLVSACQSQSSGAPVSLDSPFSIDI